MKQSLAAFLRFGLQYGGRSLWRNRRRTSLTVATVALSVAVTIVAVRFSAAIMQLWQQGAADTGAAHAQIHAEGYWQQAEGVEEKLTMKDGNSAEIALNSDPEVAGFSRRLKIEGIISAAEKTIYFIGLGVDPVAEPVVSPRLFNPQSDTGQFISAENKMGVTIGRGLSEALGLKIGDEASLISQTVAGSVNAVDVVVVGIVNVPLPSFSKRVVYLHIDQARKLLRMPERYNELAVRLNHWDAIDAWVEQTRAKVAESGAELRGWWEIEPVIRDVEEIFNSVIGAICFLLFLSAGLSVLNMIYMMVAERTVEMGTLMALGAFPMDLMLLVGLESSLIGIVGGIFGALLGNIAVVVMGMVGVPFKNPFSSGYIDVFPSVDIGLSFIIMLIGLLICVASAIPPARRASRVEPVTAFRGQIT